MTEKTRMVNLSVKITVQADELLRNHNKHKGDMSRIINSLILKEFGSEIQVPAVQTDVKT